MHKDLALTPFMRLAEALAPGVLDPARTSFSLAVDDELCMTVALHPEGEQVGVDLWCADLAPLPDDMRRLSIHLLLGLNAIPAGRFPAWVALDERDFVLLHGQAPLACLDTESFIDWLQDLIARARQVGSLIRVLSLNAPPAVESSQ